VFTLRRITFLTCLYRLASRFCITRVSLNFMSALNPLPINFDDAGTDIE
jgi:hypothetical protein